MEILEFECELVGGAGMSESIATSLVIALMLSGYREGF
jgi:hypothetical protein